VWGLLAWPKSQQTIPPSPDYFTVDFVESIGKKSEHIVLTVGTKMLNDRDLAVRSDLKDCLLAIFGGKVKLIAIYLEIIFVSTAAH